VWFIIIFCTLSFPVRRLASVLCSDLSLRWQLLDITDAWRTFSWTLFWGQLAFFRVDTSASICVVSFRLPANIAHVCCSFVTALFVRCSWGLCRADMGSTFVSFATRDPSDPSVDWPTRVTHDQWPTSYDRCLLSAHPQTRRRYLVIPVISVESEISSHHFSCDEIRLRLVAASTPNL